MFDPSELLLYACTDRGVLAGRDLLQAVRQAIAGGATMLQLREKEASSREFFQLGVAVHELTAAHGVPLVINDRVDIAQAIGAEGLHLGQSDLPVAVARRILGPDVFIGVSANTVALAQQALDEGADYIGTGPVFATGSTTDAGAVIGLEALAEVAKGISAPVVGIGGINAENAASILRAGAAGVALIADIFGAADIEAAAAKLRDVLELKK
ncbi:MAG: thiamine phosphate synthase [Propionibacteriaceae bacterium]|jgi:thiamine-phosphate pyrophosphorylase|nr:thiamine phosphate synthase [Propionibacteriaceae bacterium]